MTYTSKTKQYAIDSSPFFDKDEAGFKSKLVPLSYNEKEDYYITKKVITKSEEFIKLIVESKFNITEYYNLSDLAKTLLQYIISSQLEYNSLTFKLDAKTFATIIGIKSINRVYDATRELIIGKYIAKTQVKQVYWINHNKYYKGNRIIIKNIQSK